jgi:hypothetical protein
MGIHLTSYEILKFFLNVAKSGSTVVEPSTHNPKIEGFTPVPAVTCREKIAKSFS